MSTRGIFTVLCAIGAAVGSYFGEPFAKDNADATMIIITVLTVFAGFLIAVLGILGDPAFLPDGTWRAAEGKIQQLEDRLIRHTWLLVVYLVSIAALFLGVLLNKDSAIDEAVKGWFVQIYLFCGIFSFLLTLGLPKSILAMQMNRLERELEERRKAAGIKSDS